MEGLEDHGWQVPEDIAVLQKDETLKPLFTKAEG